MRTREEVPCLVITFFFLPYNLLRPLFMPSNIIRDSVMATVMLEYVVAHCLIISVSERKYRLQRRISFLFYINQTHI